MSALPEQRHDLDKCAGIRRLLADGFWHSAQAMRAVGGDRYGARAQEVRFGDDGGKPMHIECRVEANVSSWRMREWKPGEMETAKATKREKKTRRERELEARVAELELELQRIRAERVASAPPQMGLWEAAR